MDDNKLYGEILEEAYATGIGRTPVLPVSYPKGEIFAKMEWFNRFRSVKDRAAFFMLKSAEKTGVLTKDKTIIEASSGNTGIAIANIARLLGYHAELYVPASSSPETIARLKETGNAIIEVEDENSRRGKINIDASIRRLKERISEDPARFVNFDQYSNRANTLGHFYSTGPEITSVLDKITHVVVGIGTGGTITGLAKYFKTFYPRVKIVAVEPSADHHIQGLKNLSVSAVPDLIRENRSLIDSWITVDDSDAREGVKELMELKSVIVGFSSGANFMACRKLMAEEPGSRILTIFPDSAEKYRSVYTSTGVIREDVFDTLSANINTVPDDTILCDFSDP